MNLLTLVAGLGIANYIEYIINLIVFILKPFGIVYYTIAYDKETHTRLLTTIHKESLNTGECISKSGKKFPSGYFISKNAVGYIKINPTFIEETVIIILTSEKYYNRISEREIIKDETCKKTKELPCEINSFIRCGRYENLFYRRIKIDLKTLVPRVNQKPIVDEIIDVFNKKRIVRVFVEGPSGCGKSSIGYCLAKALNGQYTHTFNPTDAGDSFGSVLTELSSYNEYVPNIIVLEEADIMINKIHNSSVIRNEKVPTEVKDKSSWNSFLDDVVFYKNTILILTSNTPKQKLDALDSAYLRRDRIDLYFKMDLLKDEQLTSN